MSSKRISQLILVVIYGYLGLVLLGITPQNWSVIDMVIAFFVLLLYQIYFHARLDEWKEKMYFRISDITTTPGPGYVDEGNYSGQFIGDNYLYPKFKEAYYTNKTLVVDLDDVVGYGYNFLDVAFGGLIYFHKFTYEDVCDTIEIISNDEPFLKEDIEKCLKEYKK